MTGDFGISRRKREVFGKSDLQRLRDGRLSPFIADDALDLATAELTEGETRATVVSAYQLQDIADYRAALRAWFAGVRIGGHLVVVVPNAFICERQLALPVVERPSQRRLYTPRALLDEVEEALIPNSYRVRLLCDDDQGYDYSRSADEPRAGRSDILLAIEKIEQPAWLPAAGFVAPQQGPDYAFEPPRTRVETPTTRPHRKILILKLDHLGDFIISVSALQHARTVFSDAHITLVVGSWNLDLARGLGVADEVLAFDAFPRNSGEEEVDVPGKRALLEAFLPQRYDLAIDLRTDTDTRTLLGRVNAALKAGLGTKADYPFLDIALPIDLDRTQREAAREFKLNHHAFHSHRFVSRLPHRAVFPASGERLDSAIVWGPYWHLRAGRYLFEPYIEIDPGAEGLLMLDIGLNTQRVARHFIAAGDPIRLEFDVETHDSLFEFRIWAVEEIPSPSFSFFGGRLVREGIPGELHQSDYLELLITLIARRMDRAGLLTDMEVA